MNDEATPKREGVKKVAKSATLSAKEVAQELGTDARTVRKFLRKQYGNVGQGNRWGIERKEVAGLKKAFKEWAKPEEPKPTKAVSPVTSEIEEIEDLEELDEIAELIDDEE